MSSKFERSSVNLVDLPGLVQSITQQRRDGVMTVRQGKEERFLRFLGGNLVALNGPQPATFAKSLVWAEVMTPDQLSACLTALGKNFRSEHLVQIVLSRNLATKDGLLDALDCYIEEGFSEIIGWPSPRLSFSTEISLEPWSDLQASLGVSVNPGSLLLESLRRLDELKSISAHIPDAWDVLVLDTKQAPPNDLPADAARILAGWRDGLIAGSLFDRSLLPPFRATTALALLRRQAIIRPATSAELVVYADDAYSHGRHRDAFGLYRRASSLGVDNTRIHLHLGELAERFGENEAAAEYFLTAGMQLRDTGSAVIALRNNLRLGSNREPALAQLLTIYNQVGEKDESVRVLLELAQLYETRKDYDQAAKAVRQAQEFGADPVTTSLALANLAIAEGDKEQAALQLELAAHSAQYAGRNESAVNAWKQLLGILPGRSEYARECAELLAGLGRNDEAIAILRTNLSQQDPALSAVNEDALVAVYELLARLSPGDTQAHDWLAKAYERRRDRDGATQQLRHIAAAQEKAGNDGALAGTLERIVELGGNQVDVLISLAKVRTRLRQEGLAGSAWSRAADAALTLGGLKEARSIIETGIEQVPASLSLRVRQAQVAAREGDPVAALAAYRMAVDLSRGTGRYGDARDLLVQVRRLRPDDTMVRVELADVADRIGDPDLDRYLRDVVRCAVRTNNHGVALDFARRRVARSVAPGFEARNELVELLRRMGDHAGELSNGQELLNQLLEHAEFEKAVLLLQRLVVSHPRNAEMVLQLADLFAAVDDPRQASRFYRHAVSLLQLEQRQADALKALDHLAAVADDYEAIPYARAALEKGQAVDWEAIRLAISEDQRRRIASEIAVNADPRPSGSIVMPASTP